MVKRPLSFVLIPLIALASGCSGSGGLSGAGASARGGGKKSSSGDNGTLGTEQAGEATYSGGKTTSETTELGGDEGDLRIIPPEIVNGAYLTCDGERGDPNDQTSPLTYSCAARDDKGARLSLAQMAQTWSLKKKDGIDIAADELGPSADGSYDQRWQLKERIDLSAIYPQVTLANGTIKAQNGICSYVSLAGGKHMRSCIDFADVCGSCVQAVMQVSDLGGTPMSDYSVLMIPEDPTTGLCTGTASPTNLVRAVREDGRLKLTFGFTLDAGSCFQVQARLGGRTIDGAIID